MESKKQHEQNLCSLKGALNRSKSAVPPLFSGLGVLSSASNKAKLFPKNFFKNSNLKIQVSLYLLSLLELI